MSVNFFKTILTELSGFRITPNFFQIREKGHLNRPRIRNPIWFTKKNRVVHADQVTPENKIFLNEVIHDKFVAPSIIKGVSNSIVKTNSIVKHEWTPQMRRTGVLAKKIGQYPLWLKTGERLRTTLLQIIDNQIIKYIPPEEYNPAQIPNVKKLHKYGCLVIGAEGVDPSLLTKEYCGLFKESGVVPKKYLGRFIISPEAAIPPGTTLNATHFRVGDYVDVRGKTVDHGFQGVVKRHGFKGMPASHGVTKTHRRPGNIGGGGEKGRVWPGTKLPGHMGNRWRILKGLKIWRINKKYNVIWVQGSAVPGDTNSLVYIYDTILPLRKPTTAPPFPTSFDDEEIDSSPVDIWFENVHDFKETSIVYEDIKK